MLSPKGNLVTPVAFDPDGNIIPLQCTAEGYLITSSGGGGSVADIGARVYNDANISIPTGALTALTFNSERWDTDNMHSSLTNTSRLTVVTAGKYLVGGSATFDAHSTGYRSGFIRVNGSVYLNETKFTAVASPGNTGFSVVSIYSMAAGDYFEFVVAHTAGVSLNVLYAAQYTPEFWCQLLAAA